MKSRMAICIKVRYPGVDIWNEQYPGPANPPARVLGTRGLFSGSKQARQEGLEVGVFAQVVRQFKEEGNKGLRCRDREQRGVKRGLRFGDGSWQDKQAVVESRVFLIVHKLISDYAHQPTIAHKNTDPSYAGNIYW